MLAVVASAGNDLTNALTSGEHTFRQFATIAEALEAIPPASGIIVTAEEYPKLGPAISGEMLARARMKDLRLVVEYPRQVGDRAGGDPRRMRWERAVVTSDALAPDLPRGSILTPHQAWVAPMDAAAGPVHLVAARVAGYLKTAFDDPDAAVPLLFAYDPDVIVATMGISNWVRGRYFPTKAVSALWRWLVAWVARSPAVPEISPGPMVRPRFGPREPLPPNVEDEARARCLRWLEEEMVVSVDGKMSVLEGVESAIDHRGRQRVRGWFRSDCVAEAGMAIAQAAGDDGHPVTRQLAMDLLDRVWRGDDFVDRDRDHPWAELINWYERGPIFYADDQARVLLATLAARGFLNSERWDEAVIATTLANLRITGRSGFRPKMVRPADFGPGPDGWRKFQEADLVYANPHMEAYLWAANLWVYHLTGYRPLFECTERALAKMMAAYPEWLWMNGWSQEIARMLLPLAWLVRLDDTDPHRRWLGTITDAVLGKVTPAGAVREELGRPDLGIYPPPATNKAYGATEASLIQEPGDPVADLLYTVNFAVVGLHEAYWATGDPRLGEAVDRIADFLCRVQVEAPGHPYLDGAWMRGFDYARWEYGGSSADAGWGAWSVESGWTNTWIATVLGLRRAGRSLFEPTPGEPWREYARTIARGLGLDGDA